MKDTISVGFLVSRHSSLFPLVREINLLGGFKAWKVWEDRVENVPKNDILVLDDYPEQDATTVAVNNYVRKGGMVVQLFWPGDDIEGDVIVKDGSLLLPDHAPMFGGEDPASVLAAHPDLTISSYTDNGTIVSFSRNIFTGHEEDEDEDDAGRARDEVAASVPFFTSMVRFLVARRKATDAAREEAAKKPRSSVLVAIHGPSLWLGGTLRDVDVLVRSVFTHLHIEDQLPQVFKDPAYRQLSQEQATTFPDIVYYHRTFPDEGMESENKLAASFLEQARKVHARVRTERTWDMSVVPSFFTDLSVLAAPSYHGLERLYVFPPALIAARGKDANLKLLARCILQPLATTGVSSYLLTGDPGLDGVVPVAGPGTVKARPAPDPASHVLLLHGPELTTRYKDTSNEAVLARIKDLGLPGGTLKVLIHVSVDRLDLQRKIKDQSFGMKKVDEKSRERLKRLMERDQERLHAHVHVSKDKLLFEKHGFTIIEVEDSMHVEQDIKIFMIDQVLPAILTRKVARIHHVLPAGLATFLQVLATSLLDPTCIGPLEA